MSDAVVVAGRESFGVETWEAESGDARDITTHQRESSYRMWSSLGDTYQAIKFSRRGSQPVAEALRVLRPESRAPKPLFHWRHRTLPIAEENQFTAEQLEGIWQRYQTERVGEKPPQEAHVWLDNAGMDTMRRKLGGAAVPSRGKGARKSPIQYAIESVRSVQSGVGFDPADRDKFDVLLGALGDYDRLRQDRSDLEHELESDSILVRSLLLGASAIRGAYRLAAYPIKRPALGLAVWARSRKMTVKSPERMRTSLRFSDAATVTALMVVGVAAYRFFKTGLPWSHEDSHLLAGADTHDGGDSGASVHTGETSAPPVDHTLPGVDSDPTPGLTDPAAGQPPGTPENNIVFSHDALTTSSGEGWISELSQMHIRFSPGFMDKMGPWLESKGYAYKYFDHKTMSWSWGMNLKNIDPDTLKQIYKAAEQQGLVTDPLPVLP